MQQSPVNPLLPAARRVRRIAACAVFGIAFGLAHAQVQVIDSVDELLAAFAVGGAYEIVPGTYAVPEPLVAAGEVTIVGMGRESVQLEMHGGPIAVRVGEGTSVHLEGLRMVWAGDGPADLIVVRNGTLGLRSIDLGFAEAGTLETPDPWRPGGHGSALVLQGTSNAVTEDVVFARNAGNTIEVLDDATLQLVTPQVIDGHRGLVASGRAQIEVGGGVFLDQFAQGVALIGEAQADFVQTAFGGNGVLDVEAGQYLESIRVGDNARASFTGGVLRAAPATALGVGGGATVVVRGMRFEVNGAARPDLERSWSAVFVSDSAEVAVHDSSVTGSPGGAFTVRGAGTLVLDGVDVSGNGGFAHTSVSDRGQLAIQGGRFVGNAGAIFVGGEARAGIYEAELRDGVAHGVVVAQSGSVAIEGTVVAGHAERGLWVDGGASADVTGGAFEGNEMGVWLTGEATAFLTDVRVVGNRHSGVVLSGTARAVVETSEVSGHASNGVAAIEGAAVIVRDSTLRANVVNGVLVGGDATATLERNAIEGAESGVRLESQGVAQGVENTFAGNGMDVREVR
ncbi:MAG: right-handed parallel beta-helix repeat-containing protein [Trueperaceae bacterium]